MDPVTILTVAGMAFTAAERAFAAGIALGKFINDVKYVDQTLGLLVTEVNALSSACELVGKRIKGIAEAMDGVGPDSKNESPLWLQVRSQLQDCGQTVSALYEAVKDVGLEKKKNPFSQAWRQIQLNMKTKDIEESRNRIRSHTASLQLVLQAITLELSYLAPHKADQQLLVLLENIRDIKQELSQMRHTSQEAGVSDTERHHDQMEDELIKYTDKIISSGETLYEGSIAGGSVIGPSAGLDEKISSWVSRLQVLNSDTATTETEDYDFQGSSVSGADLGTMTDITSDSGMEARRSYDDDGGMAGEEDEGDDLEIEMIKEAYTLGASEFKHKDYNKASVLLQEVLTMVEESPVRSGSMLNIRDLRWMLAVCAYHTDDFQAAEAALKEIVQIPPRDQADRVRLCDAGHILALASLKQNKLAEARQYCDSALQGRRRLLGKQDPACYESLALLARIFELQDNAARAAIYSRMIPEEQREKICGEFKDLGTPVSPLVAEKKSETAEKELPPLPPGPPPYAPGSRSMSEPQSATSVSSTDAPPEQRWKFRPPIPTAAPAYEETPAATRQEESDDEDPVFPPESMQGNVSAIISGSNTFPPEKESAALQRTTTWADPSSTGPRPPAPRTQSATAGKPTINPRQETDKLAKIQTYKDEALRTERRYGKRSAPARNAVQMFAGAVHDMDLRQTAATGYHEDTLRFVKNNFEEGHPLTCKTYANLAKIAENNGDFNKSSDYYQKVLDGMKNTPVDDGTKAAVQVQMAESYVAADKPTSSYADLRAELKARRKQYGSKLRSAETADVAKQLREIRLARRGRGNGDDGASIR
ncbi:hypothetical protein AMS68_005320 [Peltaster fructicola]|uniref:Fungal N-terminal domain-containing protein n=1 Tax=Peltaster fructicola TaxID=286661 RepID=A0A6H0XYH0_9PEZI|nr:hypothetical protein AMS68_005320 [Peltaster fructicola]